MPVADVLAHLPPLALIIDHVCGNFDVSEDDDSEEGPLLALKQCDRTRRARLQIAVPNLRKFIMAVNEEFPVLKQFITRIVTPSARGQEYDLETIGNTSSVAYESMTPCANWLRPSNEISITHNRHRPCHTGTY
jgi:hypothetical protein